MKLESWIENKITEWKGKTIADHEHFLEELKELITESHALGKEEGIEEAIKIISTHSEKEGSYCDTGEDMEWWCCSDCVRLATDRLRAKIEELRKE